MNTKVFNVLIESSNFYNLKLALNQLGDNDMSDRIGLILADRNEILTRENVSISKLIKFIEAGYENYRNIVVNNIYNIDNFNGRIYANITYNKVKFSKIENDTKESSDLSNYLDKNYKYPIIVDTNLTGNVSVSFLEYNGNTKDIFDYDETEINKDELQC